MFHRSPPEPRHHHRGPRRGPGLAEGPFGFRSMLRREGRRGGVRRGEIRPRVPDALTTRPMHGYEVIQELEARSGGRWRPSAGSVYPTLQLLADEGLVTSEEVEGRRIYTLTDAGRAAAAAAPAPSPWSDPGSGQPDLIAQGRQLMGAVVQVERMGSGAARQETARILADARRQVYRLLAEDEADVLAPSAGSGDESTSEPAEATTSGDGQPSAEPPLA
jgi:DNA-binding PadR family transcriptional regulator